jgi:hypothetical protein
MICSRCRNPIRENLLACPLCAGNAGAATLTEAQPDYLRRVAAGDSPLVGAMTAGVWHFTLFQAPHTTFCNLALSPHRIRRRHWTWAEAEAAVIDPKKAMLGPVCNLCYATLQRISRGAIGEPPVPVATAEAV